VGFCPPGLSFTFLKIACTPTYSITFLNLPAHITQQEQADIGVEENNFGAKEDTSGGAAAKVAMR